MTILAVDPGPTESAFVEWNGNTLNFAGIWPNGELRKTITTHLARSVGFSLPITLAVEMIASYGMAVGREVFETCLQVGRLQQIAADLGAPCRLVYRLQVKQHLCHDSRAKDSNIRQALIDRFGSLGTKKAPGVLHGIHSHLWAALAVAVYAYDNPASE